MGAGLVRDDVYEEEGEGGEEDDLEEGVYGYEAGWWVSAVGEGVDELGAWWW